MEQIVKNRIAQTLVLFSILSVITLGIVSMVFASKIDDEQDKFGALQYIIGALLPVFGTWMGTILAYYFSKENYEAANQNTQKLLEHITTSAQKLESIRAVEKMINFSSIQFEEWEDAKAETLKISDILKMYEVKKVNRLPFLTKNKALKYIIHKSVFDGFLAKETMAGTTKASDLTLSIFLTTTKAKYPDLQSFLDLGAGFIKLEANLKEAQDIMDKNKFCQDVFVTANGDKNEQILGWVTNRVIEENARI